MNTLTHSIRVLARFAAAAAVLLLSPARSAAADGPPTSAPVRLVLWQGFKFEEVTMLRRNVDDFSRQWNAAHEQKIQIDVWAVPFPEMVKKLKYSALARQVPDMAFVDANGMVPVVYGGLARALDDIPGFPKGGAEALRPDYVPGGFETCMVTFKGRTSLFAMPAQTTTLALFWNKALFRGRAKALQDAGLDPARPPRDWDEVVRYGKVLNDPGRGVWGFGMNNSFWFTMPFFNQYGVEVVKRDPSGRFVAGLSGPRGEAALTRKANLYLKDKVEGGAWREGALDPDQGFINARYAMVLTGPWMIEKFRASGLDFGVAAIPRVPLTEAKRLGLVPPDADENSTSARSLSAGNVGGQNLVITTSSRLPEACLAFALYFTSDKVQRGWAQELGQIPVRMSAHVGLDMSKFPEIPVFIEQSRTSRALAPLPMGGVLETEIANPEMNLVLQGKQSPADALRRIDAGLTRRILTPVNEAEAEARDKK